MYTIYQFNISNYGIYVSQSLNVNSDIDKQFSILEEGTHHSLPLQLLWNLDNTLFSVKYIANIENVSLLNIVAYKYRKQFSCTLDSVYKSELVTNKYISRKYAKYRVIYLLRDHTGLVYVHDKNKQQIGIEVCSHNFQSGWYKIRGQTVLWRLP